MINHDIEFQLHPQLQQDSFSVGYFDLCEVRLINDSQYPWCILVPQRANIREIYALDPADQQQLQRESCHLAQQLALLYKADKMNVAAIGNMVPQLHLHHIVRYRHDQAWPAPVWGKFPARTYDELQREEQLQIIQRHLSAQAFPFNSQKIL